MRATDYFKLSNRFERVWGDRTRLLPNPYLLFELFIFFIWFKSASKQSGTMGQFWKSETFHKKNHRVYDSLKTKLRKWNSRESGWTGFSLPCPCILCFIPCLISFPFDVMNKQLQQQQPAGITSLTTTRFPLFIRHLLPILLIKRQRHETQQQKKKVLVQENKRFRAQRWEDIGLDSSSNIFPGPPLFSSPSTLGCSRRQSRLTP